MKLIWYMISKIVIVMKDVDAIYLILLSYHRTKVLNILNIKYIKY